MYTYKIKVEIYIHKIIKLYNNIIKNMTDRKNCEKILKEYYGYDALKDSQYEIIESCLNKNDTIGLLPTSYGKSICYQLPYLITKQNVIVVSPLISLMQDQKQDLESN